MRKLLTAILVLASGCSAPDPTVIMEADQWWTSMSFIIWSRRGVPITIANATDENQTFLVINLWEGVVEDLPLTQDGLLDLTMANVSGGVARQAARYGLVHPDTGVPEGALPALVSGQSISITIGPSGGPSPGTYVVLSGDPNAVSMGKYAQFDIGEPTS